MTNENTYKPGEKVPDSGIYDVVGPRGGKTGESSRTNVTGERFPPTPQPGQKYVIREKTPHKK